MLMKQSNQPNFQKAALDPRFVVGLVLLPLLAVGAYLGFAAFATPGGFPLDDAWIHQVFARNLAERGEFSYNPGQVVAGSTSPLWTVLLVPGYLLGGEFYRWWAYGLGVLFLALSALEVYRLYLRLFPTGSRIWAMAAAGLVIFDWRLTWAGGSGMEITMFTFGTLWLMRHYLATYDADADKIRQYICLGFIGGLLALTRPEGIVLLGLVGLDVGRRAFFGQTQGSDRLVIKWLGGRWAAVGIAWLVCLVPYVIFNYVTSKSVLPNTFGAKVGFYGNSLTLGSILDYFGQAFSLLFRPLLFLIPGWLLFFRDMTRKPKQQQWLPLIWVVGLMSLYAVRLPVLYHNGRYLMPLIPILILYGVRGSERLVELLRQANLGLLARVLPVLGLIVLGYSWVGGATTYRFDVKYINDEQVTVAKWLRDNTAPEAVIATHDIGAIRYFSGRKLVDTAGLVNPEFIPIVRDEPAIIARLRAEGVNYLAMLPTWYPQINKELEQVGGKVFQPQESYLAQYGEENMAVFKLK